MKYSILTFGCRVNQADSLAFEEQFLGHGDEPTSPEAADVVVVNTCSVTASADQGARQTLRRSPAPTRMRRSSSPAVMRRDGPTNCVRCQTLCPWFQMTTSRG